MADFTIDAEVVPKVDRRAKKKVQDELSAEITVSGAGGSGASTFGRDVNRQLGQVIDELEKLNKTATQLLGVVGATTELLTGAGRGGAKRAVSGAKRAVSGAREARAFSVLGRRGAKAEFGPDPMSKKGFASKGLVEMMFSGRLDASLTQQLATSLGALEGVIEQRGINLSRRAIDYIGDKFNSALSFIRNAGEGEDRGTASPAGVLGLGIRGISTLVSALAGGTGVAGLAGVAGAGVAGALGAGGFGLFDRLTGGPEGKFKLRNLVKGSNVPNTTLPQTDDPSEGIDPDQSVADFAGERFQKTFLDGFTDGVDRLASINLGEGLQTVGQNTADQLGNISLDVDTGRLPSLPVPDAISNFSWPRLPESFTGFSWPMVPSTLTNFSWPSLPSAFTNFSLPKPDWLSSAQFELPKIDLTLPSFDFTPNINTTLDIDVNSLISSIRSEIEQIAERVVQDFLDDFQAGVSGL